MFFEGTLQLDRVFNVPRFAHHSNLDKAIRIKFRDKNLIKGKAYTDFNAKNVAFEPSSFV